MRFFITKKGMILPSKVLWNYSAEKTWRAVEFRVGVIGFVKSLNCVVCLCLLWCIVFQLHSPASKSLFFSQNFSISSIFQCWTKQPYRSSACHQFIIAEIRRKWNISFQNVVCVCGANKLQVGRTHTHISVWMRKHLSPALSRNHIKLF
jgi:hypothetical protein